MNAEEFIEQYGKVEMMKAIKIEEHKTALENNSGFSANT